MPWGVGRKSFIPTPLSARSPNHHLARCALGGDLATSTSGWGMSWGWGMSCHCHVIPLLGSISFIHLTSDHRAPPVTKIIRNCVSFGPAETNLGRTGQVSSLPFRESFGEETETIEVPTMPKKLGEASKCAIQLAEKQFGALAAVHGSSYPKVKGPLTQIRKVYKNGTIARAVNECYRLQGAPQKLLSRFDQNQMKLGLIVSLERALELSTCWATSFLPYLSDSTTFLASRASRKSLKQTSSSTFSTCLWGWWRLSLGESSCHDLVWLTTVAGVTRLAPYIRTELPIVEWPTKLRNAFAHSQWKEEDGHLVAYDSTPGKRSSVWYIRVPISTFRGELKEMFAAISKLYQWWSHQHLPGTLPLLNEGELIEYWPLACPSSAAKFIAL